jgi:hypothetical protein
MNRRSFLGLSSAALAAFTLDPERALWVPGQRSYFDIVRPGQWREMAVTPETVARILGVPLSMIDASEYPTFKLGHYA